MKLAVVGSRSLKINIERFVDKNTTMIISGGAAGIDTVAADFAKKNNLPLCVFKPDYIKFGKFAPILRNKQIVKKADSVLAIWDGKSRGTAHAIKLAKLFDKPIRIYIIDKYTEQKKIHTKTIQVFSLFKEGNFESGTRNCLEISGKQL